MIAGSSRRNSIGSRNGVAALRRSITSRNGTTDMPLHNGSNTGDGIIKVPVVGYEVKEETGRFTVFKLQVTNEDMSDRWLVLRRYTDFERLSAKLKEEFPHLAIMSLPPKRWLKNNFETTFLEDRMKGIQAFVDSILIQHKLSTHSTIRAFFCLDEPPMYPENAEESRAVFGTLEEDMLQLKTDLNNKDKEIWMLKQQVQVLKLRNEALAKLNGPRVCRSCNNRLSNNTLSSTSKSAGFPIQSSTPFRNGDPKRNRTRSAGNETSSMPAIPKGRLIFKSPERSLTSPGRISLEDYKTSSPVVLPETKCPVVSDLPLPVDTNTLQISSPIDNHNGNGTEHFYSASSIGDLNLNQTSSPFEMISSSVFKMSTGTEDNSSFEVIAGTESPTKDTNHNKITAQPNGNSTTTI